MGISSRSITANKASRGAAQVLHSAQMQHTAGSMPVVIMANAIALVVLCWQIVVNNALSLSVMMMYGNCFIKGTK